MLEQIEKEGLTETYYDVQDMLYECAHRHARMFPIPFNEIVSVGHDLFMYCARKYNPSNHKAHFSTYFRFVLDRQLLTRLTKEANHQNYEEINDDLAGCTDVNLFFLQEFQERLSQDANYIVNLIFNMPDEVSDEFKWNDVNTSGKYLKQISYQLTEEGWEPDRIEWALAEIEKRLGTKELNEATELNRQKFKFHEAIRDTEFQLCSATAFKGK